MGPSRRSFQAGVRVIGSLLFWSWVLLWGSVIAVLGLLLFVPFNPWTDPRLRVMGALTRLWGWGAFRMVPGFRVEVVGLERLGPGQGPYVLCPNHQSFADVPLLLMALPQFKFIAKTPLFWTPPLGLQMRLAGYVEASRGEAGGAERVLARSIAWLRRGVHVLVFPEGTRSPDGRVQRFGQGPFALAQRAGVPVVPVAVMGTRKLVPKGDFRFDFSEAGNVRIEILEPIPPTGEARELASRARARIQEAVGQSSAGAARRVQDAPPDESPR
ncbi:MAG: 1-acyl-sn-glycerol-3-phosphate acyltransferase [Myxococcaceae bacterium]|nr:1-acyl-sn-glycerol-3-phosphate acyltransferase [Myxococcaceae bacterium]MCI0673307.1 1-acyl-sn-glycerol-3-phosphate acyltransferase [Myxococcaceae bacterium]